MRLFAASLATETNTFSPIPTDLESFTGTMYFRPGEHPDDPKLCTAPLWVARRRAKAEGWMLVEGSCFWAEPSGTVARGVYERMRDEILGQLEAAMPVDGVLLGLHGAMVADGVDDCEGDLLARVRALAGPNVPIGVELDPHCHLTEKRVRNADVIVLFKEFPHTDFVERGEEVVELTLKAIRGDIRPVMSLYDCRMISSFPTTREPMRSFVDKVKALEGRDGVLSVSIGHCFPYADVPEIGARILVVTDNAKAKGDALAEELGREFLAMRGRTMPPFLAVDEAIDAALAEPAGPVVVADPADNAGGGAPSDNTTILRRLLERGVARAAVGPIWDPVAVQVCRAAGEGSRIPLRFGGKFAATSGLPVDGEVEVVRTVRDAWQSFGQAKVPLGDAASIRLGGVEVALISGRTQALGTDLFTGLGIDLASKRIVVVKSTNHFHAAFSKVASRVLYANSDGPLNLDFRKVPYRRVARPIWPLDESVAPGLLV